MDIAKALQTTPINYAIHRSRYKRFPDKPLMNDGPDVVYDVDCALAKNKASLYTAVVKSPVSYRWGRVGAVEGERSGGCFPCPSEERDDGRCS